MPTTASSACNGGVAGGIGSAAQSRTASSSVCGPTPRRRGVSRRKPSWERYEAHYRAKREISPQAVQLVEERLAGFGKLNKARKRACFYLSQCLSRYDKAEGARIRQKDFASDNIGRFAQEGMIATGLATCLDWDSWKPTGYDLKNAKARAFVPCVAFLLADTGPEVVLAYADYVAGRCEPRRPLHDESQLVVPNPDSGVTIPANVMSALQCGTGLYCNFESMRGHLLSLPECQQSRFLCAALSSVGRMQCPELRPVWTQHEWGRLYCKQPACINLPRTLIPSLRSVEGLPLWCVDFSSFELRIACMECDQKIPDGDVYQLLGDISELSRNRVKTIVNSRLHGQTNTHLWYAPERDREAIADRPLVEQALAVLLPNLSRGLGSLLQDPTILQRQGAVVFFECMEAALYQCEIQSAGLPKHDGWIFAGTEAQAKAVKSVFEAKAERITGVPFPVKLEAIC